jgi:hypothetical protein
MDQPPLDRQRARAAILASLANGKSQRRESLLRIVADQGLLLPADALNPRTPSDYGPLNYVLGELIMEGCVHQSRSKMCTLA